MSQEKTPFTLLQVKASEPYHDHLGTIHGITIVFAQKSDVRFNRETVEVQSSDLTESYISFRVGEDMEAFAKGLRNLADHLDSRVGR